MSCDALLAEEEELLEELDLLEVEVVPLPMATAW